MTPPPAFPNGNAAPNGATTATVRDVCERCARTFTYNPAFVRTPPTLCVGCETDDVLHARRFDDAPRATMTKAMWRKRYSRARFNAGAPYGPDLPAWLLAVREDVDPLEERARAVERSLASDKLFYPNPTRRNGVLWNGSYPLPRLSADRLPSAKLDPLRFGLDWKEV